MKPSIRTFAAIASMLAVLACNKETVDSNVAITTSDVTDITDNSAKCGGEITSDGGAAVRMRGVCWGTSANPTIAGAKTENGKGTGKFSSELFGLEPGLTYYVRAYAVNANGTFYGNEVTFLTGKSLPMLSTMAMFDVTCVSAKTGGVISSAGGDEVSACGVCWGESPNPDISGNKTVDVPGEDGKTFVSEITGLEQDKEYYVRAYATNSLGTAYGNEVRFSTSTEPVVEFADENLAAFIVSAYDLNNDGKLQESEAGKIRNIDCGAKGIKSLGGIENLHNLKELRVTGNELTSIDISANSELELLQADGNPLKSLEFGAAHNPKLEYINIHGNQLTSLDCNNMTSLKFVHCGDSSVSSMNFSGCSGLLEAYLFNNPGLISLDFKDSPNLSILWAFTCTNLGSVNVEPCSKLTYIACDQSGLTEIKLADKPLLTDVVMWGNRKMTKAVCCNLPECRRINFEQCEQLSDVTFTNIPAVEWFNIIVTSVNSLDFSGMTKLNWLAVRDIPTLEKMNLDNTPSLVNLYGWNTSLTTLDLRGCSKNMNEVFLDANPKLTEIYVASDQQIASLHKDESCAVK